MLCCLDVSRSGRQVSEVARMLYRDNERRPSFTEEAGADLPTDPGLAPLRSAELCRVDPNDLVDGPGLRVEASLRGGASDLGRL